MSFKKAVSISDNNARAKGYNYAPWLGGLVPTLVYDFAFLKMFIARSSLRWRWRQGERLKMKADLEAEPKTI